MKDEVWFSPLAALHSGGSASPQTTRGLLRTGAKQVFFLGTQETAFSHGTFLDCGFVLDNLMLGLTSLGFGSCPQFSVMVYPDLLKKHIPGSDDTLFIAGLPFGRPKGGSHINSFQPQRLPVENWFKVVG